MAFLRTVFAREFAVFPSRYTLLPISCHYLPVAISRQRQFYSSGPKQRAVLSPPELPKHSSEEDVWAEECLALQKVIEHGPNFDSSDGDRILKDRALLRQVMSGDVASLPAVLQLKSQLKTEAIVYGIRHHSSFAQSQELENICQNKEYSETFRQCLNRARNARLIMDNVVPRINSTSDMPYCIWHPQTAKEQTYRDLVKEYPRLRYQVGRACAVAGYIDLYAELNLLPEVSIAEEARDSTKGGKIFQRIMAGPFRYKIMNDYQREVNEVDPEPGACLNGDTAVVASLDHRMPLEDYDSHYGKWFSLDILEDGHIRLQGEAEEQVLHLFELPRKWAHLLYSPLPNDLPTTNKELLILMAAYEGNVDRYARLARPLPPNQVEMDCIMRGIFHSTTFAKWWACRTDPLGSSEQLQDTPWISCEQVLAIRRAINARFIMSNDLQRIAKETCEGDIPYMIWYPLLPHPQTLQTLLEIQPAMKTSIAHACIAADYQGLFDAMDVEPDFLLAEEARKCGNKHYIGYLERKAAEVGKELMHLNAYRPCGSCGREYSLVTQLHKERTEINVLEVLAGEYMSSANWEYPIYEGYEANSSQIERYICSIEDPS